MLAAFIERLKARLRQVPGWIWFAFLFGICICLHLWAPGWLWVVLLMVISTASAVIWFFRIQLRFRPIRTESEPSWGRLALGVWICMWLVGLFLSWPWLNWHYAVVFFRYEVPHNIGLVVVPCFMAASGLTWLYFAVADETGSAGFWLAVSDRFEWLCLKVLGGKHLKLFVRAHPKAKPMEAMAFGYLAEEGRQSPGEGQRLRLVYRLDVNHFMGTERAQLLVEHLEPVLG